MIIDYGLIFCSHLMDAADGDGSPLYPLSADIVADMYAASSESPVFPNEPDVLQLCGAR